MPELKTSNNPWLDESFNKNTVIPDALGFNIEDIVERLGIDTGDSPTADLFKHNFLKLTDTPDDYGQQGQFAQTDGLGQVIWAWPFGGLKSGSVIFAGGIDILNEDNVTFFWDNKLKVLEINAATDNIFIGKDVIAGGSSTGTESVIIGHSAGYYSTGGGNNVFIGKEAGWGNTSGDGGVYVGRYAGYNTGGANDNVAIGHECGYELYGGGNTLMGFRAGYGESGGTTNYISAVCIGNRAGYNLHQGDYNVLVGRNAGFNIDDGENNVCIGRQIGDNITSGSSNVIIGDRLDAPSATGDNQILIGSSANLLTVESTSLLNQDLTTDADVTFNKLVLSTIAAAGVDTDKFLVLDASNNVDYRTGANVLSDIGGQPLDDTLTALAGLNTSAGKYIRVTGTDTVDLRTYANVLSDLSGAAGAAFSWNSQGLTNVGTISCGKLFVESSGGGDDRLLVLLKNTIAAGFGALTIEGNDSIKSAMVKHSDDYIATPGFGGTAQFYGLTGTSATIVGVNTDDSYIRFEAGSAEWRQREVMRIDALGNLNVGHWSTAYNTYTASQTGTTITSSVGSFSASDIGRYFLWDGSLSHHNADKITAYTNSTTVTVEASRTIASQTGSTRTMPITFFSNTPAIKIGEGVAEDTKLYFHGNAQDYYLGLDDTDDAFKIGLGQIVGTTPFVTILSSGNVGIKTTSPDADLEIIGLTGISLADVETDATDKYSILSAKHYTNAEEALVIFRAQCFDVHNNILIGGGSDSFNTATRIGFYTAADTTTTVGTERMVIKNTGAVLISGTVFIGDTSNSKMTLGLTLNQAGNDNQILTFKSSDVAHGVTTYDETDTYASFTKNSAAEGGLYMHCFSETLGAFNLGAIPTTDNTNKTSAALAPISLNVRKKDGTGVQAVGANANLMVIRNNSSTRFIFNENGDTYQNGGLSLGFATFGTNAVNVLTQATGTVPASSPADCFQMYSADVGGAAGEAGVHFLDELGLITILGGGGAVFDKTSGKGIRVDTTTPTFGWRDLQGDILVKTVGANDPDYDDYASTGIHRYQFKNTAVTEVFNDFHIPHDYVPGTEVYVHIHWSQTVIDTGGAASAPGVAKWYFDANYSKGHDRGAFPASVTTVSVTQTASGTIRKHLIAEVQLSTSGQIGGQDLEPDGIVTVRTYRDSADGSDTLDQRPWVHHIDIHYQSTNIATKDKAPDFYA